MVIAISSKGDSKHKQYNNVFEYSRVLLTKGLRNYMLPTDSRQQTAESRQWQSVQGGADSGKQKPKDSRSGSCEISETDFKCCFCCCLHKLFTNLVENRNFKFCQPKFMRTFIQFTFIHTQTDTNRDTYMMLGEGYASTFHFISFVLWHTEKSNRDLAKGDNEQYFGGFACIFYRLA